MKLLVCILTLFLSFSTWAVSISIPTEKDSSTTQQESLTGYIVKTNHEVYIRFSDSGLYALRIDDPALCEYRNTFDSGDMVTGMGFIDPEKIHAHFSSIDFVGLKSLLGLWKSKDNKLFYFSSFSDLTITKAESNTTQGSKEQKEEKFTYSLTPYGQIDWAIYLSNANGTQIYLIKIKKNKVTIFLIDENSQKQTPKFELTKFSSI